MIDFGAGEFGVKNIELNLKRFQEIETPVEIKHVSLGEVRLKIPALWKLTKAPIKVKVEKLFVVVGPSNVSRYTIDERKARMKATKKLALFVMGIISGTPTPPEYAGRKEKADKMRNILTSKELFGLPGILKKLVPIVDNVQIEVCNIHVRYEDGISKPTNPFAVGLCLDSIAVRGSTTESGEDTFVTEWNIDNFRKVFLNNFSIYIDTEGKGSAELANAATKQRMNDLIYRGYSAPNAYSEEHEFFLQPLSLGARAQWHRGYDLKIPMVDANASVPHVGLTLSHAQYTRALDAASHYNNYAARLKFGYLAPPQESPSQNPRAWWRYVIGCVLRRVRHRMKRYKPERVFRRLSDRTTYINIMRERYHLGSGWISSSDKAKIEDIELNLKYRDIIQFRKMAKLSLIKDKHSGRISRYSFVAKAVPALKIGVFVAIIGLISLILLLFLPAKAVLGFAAVALAAGLIVGGKFFFGRPAIAPFDESQDNWNWIFRQLGQNTAESEEEMSASRREAEHSEPIFPAEYALVTFNANIPRVQLDVNMFGTRPYDSSILTMAVDGVHATGSIGIPSIAIKASVDTINAVERISLPKRKPLHVLSHVYPRIESESAAIDPADGQVAAKGIDKQNRLKHLQASQGSNYSISKASQLDIHTGTGAGSGAGPGTGVIAEAGRLAKPTADFIQTDLIDRVDVSKLILGAPNRLHEISDALVQKRFLNVDVSIKPNTDLDVGVKVVTTTFNLNASIPFVNSMMGFFTPQKNRAEIREMTHAASLRMAVQTIDSVKAAIRNRQVIALDIAIAGPTIVFAQSYNPGVEADAMFLRLGPVALNSNPKRATDPENWTEDDCYDLYRIDARNISITMQHGVWHDVNTARRIAAAMAVADAHTHSDLHAPSLRNSSIAIEELSDVDSTLQPLLKSLDKDEGNGSDTEDDASDGEFDSDDDSDPDNGTRKLSPRPSIEEPADGHDNGIASKKKLKRRKKDGKNEASSSAAPTETSPTIEKVKDGKKKKKHHKAEKDGENEAEKKEKKEKKNHKRAQTGPSSPSSSPNNAAPRVEEPMETIVEQPISLDAEGLVVSDDAYVLHPLSAVVKAYVCVAGSIVGMPATKVEGDVTPVSIFLSPSRAQKILAICMAQFPPLTAKRVKKVAHEPLGRKSFTPAAPPGVADSKLNLHKHTVSATSGLHDAEPGPGYTIAGHLSNQPSDPSSSDRERIMPEDHAGKTYFEEIEVPAGRHHKKPQKMFIERSMPNSPEASSHTDVTNPGAAAAVEDLVESVAATSSTSSVTINAPTATTADAKAAIARGEIPPEIASAEATREAQTQAEKSAEMDNEYAQTLQEVVDAAAEVADREERPEPGQEPHEYAPVCDLDDVSGFEKYMNLKLPGYRALLLGAFQIVGVTIHICQDPIVQDPLLSSSLTSSKGKSAVEKNPSRTVAKLIVGPISAHVDINSIITSVSAKVAHVQFEEFIDESFKVVPENTSKAESDRSFMFAIDHPEYGAISLDLKAIPRDSPIFSDTLMDVLVNTGKLVVNVRRPAILILTKLIVSCLPSNFVLPAFGVHPALPVMKLSDLPSIDIEGEIESFFKRTGTYLATNQPFTGLSPSNVQVPETIESKSGESSKPGEPIDPRTAGKSSASSSPLLRPPTPTAPSVTTDVATAASNAAEATDTSPEVTESTLTNDEISKQQESSFPSLTLPVNDKLDSRISKASEADAVPPSPSPSSSAMPSSRSHTDIDDLESIPSSARSEIDDDEESDDEEDASEAPGDEDGNTTTDAESEFEPLQLPHGTVGGADLQPVLIEVEPDDGVVENLREKEATRAIVVRANVPVACFHLIQGSTKLLSLAVTNVIACVDVRGDDKLLVQGRVNRISVDAAHDGIGGLNMVGLVQEDSKLLDFKFGMTPSSCTDYAGHDMLVALEVAQIRATYYHIVVMSLVNWSNNFVDPLLIILKPLKAPIKLSKEARAARRAYRKTLIANGDDYLLRMYAQSVPRSKKHRNNQSTDQIISRNLLDNIVLPKAPKASDTVPQASPSVYGALTIQAAAMPTTGDFGVRAIADNPLDGPPPSSQLLSPDKQNSMKAIKDEQKKAPIGRKSSRTDEDGDEIENSADTASMISNSGTGPASFKTPSKKSSKKSKPYSMELSEDDLLGGDTTSDDSDVGTSAPPTPRSDSALTKKKKKTVSSTKKRHSRQPSGASVDDLDSSFSETGPVGLDRRHSISLPVAGVPDLGSDDPFVVSPRKKSSRASIHRSVSSTPRDGKKTKSKTRSVRDKLKKRKKKFKAKSQEKDDTGGLKQPKIKIEAIISSPVLIIPVDPEDVEKGGYLEINAGHIEIENEILVAGQNLVTDTLSLSLTHLNMVFQMPESVQTASHLTFMDHTGLTGSMQRVLGGDDDHTLPMIGIDVEMLPIHVSFGTPQLELIFHMLSRHMMLPIPKDTEVSQYFRPLSGPEKAYYDYEQRMLSALEVQHRVTRWKTKNPDVDPLSPAESFCAIRISARLLHFALDICDTHMTPQMRIDVRQLGALVKMQADGFTAVESALQSIGVMDTVISLDHFNTLFAKPARISEPMCQLAFVLNPGANAVGIKGAVHSPTIVLMPETMMRFRNAWEEPLTRGITGLTEMSNAKSQEAEPKFERLEDNKKKGGPKREEVPNMMPSVKCGVLISSPMIAIVPVANSASTPGFTIDLGEIIINVDMEPQLRTVTGTLGISHLRVIRSFLSAGTLQSVDEQYLLHPMELKSSVLIKGSKINISAVLPLVQFIASFRDVELGVRIFEAYKPLIDAFTPSDKGKGPRGPLDQSSSGNGTTTASTALSTDTMTDTHSEDSSPSSTTEVPVSEKDKITALVEFTAIDIAVIDDRFKGDFFVPIFRMTLGPLHGRFNLKGQTMDGTFGLRNVAASVYNRPYGGWEPTLEPWEMSVGFQKDSHGISARMIAEQHMEFTINHALLEGVFELLEIVIPPPAETPAQRKKRRKQALRPTLDPLVIRNWTGVPVTVQLKEVVEPFEVGTGESRALVMKRMTRAEVIAKPPKYTFSVFVQGASAPAKLNATRVDTMIVPYKLEDPDSIFVAEVETEQGSRIITVRGTYKVKNTTTTAIEIMLTKLDGSPIYKESVPGSEDKEKEPQVITVEPNGGTFCASVTQSATRAIRIRTLGYDWSDCLRFTEPKPAYVLRCKQKSGPDGPKEPAADCDWYATARVDVGNEGDDFSLVIAPPVNVENLCTVPLQVKFVNIKKEKESMRAIAKEEKEKDTMLRSKEKELRNSNKSDKSGAESKKPINEIVEHGAAPSSSVVHKPEPSAHSANTPDERGLSSSSHSREPSLSASETSSHKRQGSSALTASTSSAPKYEPSQDINLIPTWDVIECDDEDVHQLPSFDETLAICLKLPDFGWSKPLPFVTKLNIKRDGKFDSDTVLSKTIEVPDENGYMLKVGVDVVTTDTSARAIKLFARAWIVNDTGLPLFFKKDKDEKYLAAGQHNAKGYDMRLHTDGLKKELKERDSALASGDGDKIKSRLDFEDQHKWYDNPTDLIAVDETDANVTEVATDYDSNTELRPGFSAPTMRNIASARELKKAEKARLDAELSSTHYHDSDIHEVFSCRSISPGYGPYFYYGEKKLSIALENSSWSGSNDLGVRDEGTIDIEDSATGRLYSFFILITPAPSRFWRTSIVRIYPRFVLSNASAFPLILRQLSEPYDSPTALRLEPGDMLPYHFASYKRPQKLAAHVADRPHLCTGYFELDEVGRFPLRFHDTQGTVPVKHGKKTICAPLPIPSSLDDNLFFAGLHVTNMGDSSIFVRFLDDAPEEYYTISNQTNTEIVIREYQSDSKLSRLHFHRSNEGASLATSNATVDNSGLEDTENDVEDDPLADSDAEPEKLVVVDDGSSNASSAPAEDLKIYDKEKKAREKELEKQREKQRKADEKAAKKAAKDAKKMRGADDASTMSAAINTMTDNTLTDDASTATATPKKKKGKYHVDVEIDEDEAELRGAQIYILKPKRKEAFMFPRPQHSKHKIQFQLAGDSTWHDVNLDKIQQKPSVKLADRRYLHMRTAAVGQSKQLIVKIASKEAKTDEEQLAAADGSAMKFEILMAGLGISIVDRKPQELAYARMAGLKLNLGMNSIEQNLEVKLGFLQVDNCLYSTPHAVVAHSIDQPDAEPFFHLALVRDLRYKKFLCFRYFSVKMHKLATRLDMPFAMNAMVWGLNLYKWIGERTSYDIEQKTIMGDGEGKIKTPYVSAVSNGFYFEVFHLNPMSFLISFVPSSNFECPAVTDDSAAFIASVAPHLMTIQEAPLFLSGLLLTNCFTSQDEFISRITGHYIKSFLKQLLYLAGSADALGNPVSLVNSLGAGVYDLVHEPAAGLTESPAKFGIGIAKGAASMMKHSMRGFLSSAEKLIGNVSKLGEKVSMDKDYQHDREKMKMKRANHVGAGLGMGIREFGTGIFHGISGVVVQPAKGAKREGIKGFATGIGKGLVGVVVKPTVGLVDLVTRTTEGIRNTGSDLNHVKRIRDPRFIGSDLLLPAYDAYKAEGQLFLRTINDGKYKNEFYAWHKAPSHKTMVLVTNTRLMYLKHHTVDKVISSGNKWSIKWREHLLVFSEVITRDTTKSKLILKEKDEAEAQGNTLAISHSVKPPTAEDAPSAADEDSAKAFLKKDAKRDDDDEEEKKSTDELSLLNVSSLAPDAPGKDKKRKEKEKAKEKEEERSRMEEKRKEKERLKEEKEKSKEEKKEKERQKERALITSPSKSDINNPKNDPSSSGGQRTWKIKYHEPEDADDIVKHLIIFIQDAPIHRPRAKALSLLRNFPRILGRRKATKRDIEAKEARKAAKKEAKAIKGSLQPGKANSAADSSKPSVNKGPATGEPPLLAKDSWSSSTSSSSSSSSLVPSDADSVRSPAPVATSSKKERRKSITSPGIPVDPDDSSSKKSRDKLSKRAETDVPSPEGKKKTHKRTLTADLISSETEGTPQSTPRKEKNAKSPRPSTSDQSGPASP